MLNVTWTLDKDCPTNAHCHCHEDKTVTALRLWVILSGRPAPNCLIFQRSPLITAVRVRVNVPIEDCAWGGYFHISAALNCLARALPTFLIFILLHERLLDMPAIECLTLKSGQFLELFWRNEAKADWLAKCFVF